MHSETRTDGFTAVEDRFAGYTVYDGNDEKIGKIDDLAPARNASLAF